MALTNLNAAVAWTLQSVNSAQNGRFHIGTFIPSAAATTGLTAWRDGVIVSTNQGGLSNIPNDLQIKAVTPTPSLSLTVEAGHCVITRAGQGPYLCYVQTQSTLTLAAADPTNPRIDRIVAQVYDSALSDTLPTTPVLAAPGGLVIRAVTGTPAGSPSAPATPTGAISLATVAVAANATQILTANITDTRRSAGNPGGARPLLPGDAAADAGTVSGDLTHRPSATDGGAYVWSGTRWKSLTVPVFTNPAARDAAITAPYTDELAVASDTHLLWVYNGSEWISPYDQTRWFAERTTTSTTSASTTHVGVLRLDNVPLVQNQMVRVTYGCHPDSTVTSDTVITGVRVNNAGVATTASPRIYKSYAYGPPAVGPRNWAFTYLPPSTGTYSFLLSFARNAGSGTCNLFCDADRGTELYVTRLVTNLTDTGTDV